ncbi:MAG: tetratricopeptide repeat protein [Gammaproteobacteria bacterium]|nr:tetratricopeptide repeat protein [Gammaproteobacteria bacterium]
MKRSAYRVAAIVVVLVVIVGALIQRLPGRATLVAAEKPPMMSSEHTQLVPAHPPRPGEVHERFQQAAIMLHAGQYLYALEALERVITLAPAMPEARVNAGFALLGVEQHARAAAQFRHAIDLRPGQTNAYYGLAVALEAMGDLESALGAMRTYIHLESDDAVHLRRARAAIWEWEQQRSLVQPVEVSDDSTPLAANHAPGGG